jgi:DNA polymerase I-like protein with 3'-5' exonuclease and polymerase domains
MQPVIWSWYEGGELPQGDVLSFDVENDFYQLKAAKIKAPSTVTQCAVSNGTDTVVARGQGLRDMLCALEYTALKGTALVGHNAWYADVPWIRATRPRFPYNTGETMALGYLMDETQPLALKDLCMKYLPDVEDWKDGITLDQTTDEFAEYNATDALLTMRLYERLSALLGGRVRLVPRIIMPAMLALAACSSRGIYLDKHAIGLADEFYRGELSAATASLQVLGVDSPRKRALVGQALLADNHKLGTTETGKPSTSKATLARLKSTPLVEALKDFWKLDKAYSAYVKRYKKLSESGDGRSHSEYTVLRTVTGRTSNSDQQLPRTPLLHAFFSAPSGFNYVSADYSAVEFRVAAWVAGEQGIIRRYRDNPSFDPHRWFAAMLYGKPGDEITKDERQIAKSANFGLLYMAQPGTLVEYVRKTTGRELPLKEASRIYKLWHSELPAFKPWYGRTWDFLSEHDFVESVTGRRRHFTSEIVNPTGLDKHRIKPVLKQPAWMRAAALREGVNFQVQSLAADIALIALRKCELEGLPVNGFVHDSVTFELEEGVDITEKLEKYMVRYPVWYLKKHFNVDFTLPLQIEVS